MKFREFLDKRFYSFNDIVPVLRECGFDKIADRMTACGDFYNVAVCRDCHTQYFNGFQSCKIRYCPSCAKKRSLLYFSRLYPKFQQLIDNGYKLNFLTLTIKDMDNLEECLKILKKSFRYMIHGNRRTCEEFKKRFVGGVRSLEVKIGENSGQWHCHLHCIVVKGQYSKDFEWLRDTWNDCVNVCANSSKENKIASVDIRAIKNYNDNVLKSTLELFKYITKFDFMKHKDKVVELVENLKNVRQASSWGIFYNFDDGIEQEMGQTYTAVFETACKVCGSKDFEEIDIYHKDFRGNLENFEDKQYLYARNNKIKLEPIIDKNIPFGNEKFIEYERKLKLKYSDYSLFKEYLGMSKGQIFNKLNQERKRFRRYKGD